MSMGLPMAGSTATVFHPGQARPILLALWGGLERFKPRTLRNRS